jgi:tetratricopeptide (TPR) repeat protein
MERAQALGFMNTPRDNYNLVTLYLNAGQFGIATDMLHAGLKNGTIESTVNNWRILGAYYQQANKELQAIDALKEATKLFPDEGSIELLIGQIYQALDKIKDAHDHYIAAVKKGNIGDKPHLAYLYLAYTAIELADYEGAQKAITEAAKTPDGAKDPQVKSVKDGIEQTIAERDRIKAAAEASAKKL